MREDNTNLPTVKDASCNTSKKKYIDLGKQSSDNKRCGDTISIDPPVS